MLNQNFKKLEKLLDILRFSEKCLIVQGFDIKRPKRNAVLSKLSGYEYFEEVVFWLQLFNL